MIKVQKAPLSFRLLSLFGALALNCCVASAASPKINKIHLHGKSAQTLISLFVTGSDDVSKAIESSSAHQVILRDVEVESIETYKYEPDTWIYKLPGYRATGKIGDDGSQINIGEATSLFSFFLKAGITSDLAMDGSYINIQEVSCKIDVHVDISNPNRFQCDLILPNLAQRSFPKHPKTVANPPRPCQMLELHAQPSKTVCSRIGDCFLSVSVKNLRPRELVLNVWDLKTAIKFSVKDSNGKVIELERANKAGRSGDQLPPTDNGRGWYLPPNGLYDFQVNLMT